MSDRFSHSSATLSTCGLYRYDLERGWGWEYGIGQRVDEYKPFVLWVLFNPSVADSNRDDPTVRKAANFSALWGYERMVFVNLFAFRATNPRTLTYSPYDIVGPDNDSFIEQWSVKAAYEDSTSVKPNKVVVAWGKNPIKGNQRHHTVLRLLRAHHPHIECLGINDNGHPTHPLMLSYKTTLREYQPV